MSDVIGWDIGGVNTKVARVSGGAVLAACGRPFELQRDPHALVPLLRELTAAVGGDAGSAHAVTMTAELSQMFRTKREGVAFVLAAVAAAVPSALVRVYAVDGRFLTIGEACQEPLAVASANWAATAQALAAHHPDALLVDIGTTTTDIIPIVGGAVAAEGRTDPGRLASGELVYTGVLRTPVEAIASHVEVAGTLTGVSAEGFALAGDVHLWRGDLDPADYTCPTPDGRPASREFAGERLARVVCADRELLDEAAVSSIADALAGAQVRRIAAAIARVRTRHRSLRTAVVTGLGAFLGRAAAAAAEMTVEPLAAELGDAAARCAPAVSVALLLDRALGRADRADLKVCTTTDARADLKVCTTTDARADLKVCTTTDARADLKVCTTTDVRADVKVCTTTDARADLKVCTKPDGRADLKVPTTTDVRADLKVPTPTEVVQAFRPAVTDVAPSLEPALVEIVVKLGGGVLRHAEHFAAVLEAIAAASRERPLLVVPGGGPFADAVRDVDRQHRLPDEAAHWMAVLAMDQYAHLLVARLAGAMLVEAPDGIAAAIDGGRVPVLAPSRWLRAADPLPHAWEVTSDSLAAWIAGVVGARRLVLVKPPGASGEVVDGYFARALPASVTAVAVAADRRDALRSALSPRSA